MSARTPRGRAVGAAISGLALGLGLGVGAAQGQPPQVQPLQAKPASALKKSADTLKKSAPAAPQGADRLARVAAQLEGGRVGMRPADLQLYPLQLKALILRNLKVDTTALSPSEVYRGRLRVYLDESGAVTQARLERSTGAQTLDLALEQAVADFAPGTGKTLPLPTSPALKWRVIHEGIVVPVSYGERAFKKESARKRAKTPAQPAHPQAPEAQPVKEK